MSKSIYKNKQEKQRIIIISRLKQIVSSREGYFSESKYKNTKTPLNFRCKKGHEWVTSPRSVLSGSWCKKCWCESRAGKHLKLKDGLFQAKEIAKSRAGVCLSEDYIATNKLMRWRCQNGHEWLANLCEVKRGRWCPSCSANVRERFCRSIIELLTGHTFPKSKPKWLLNSRGNRMELDGYCKELHLAFEHHGEQHYREVKHFNRRNETLALRKQDDTDKRNLCEENDIILVEIPFHIPEKKLFQWLGQELSKSAKHIKLNKVTPKISNRYVPSNELSELQEIANIKGGLCI